MARSTATREEAPGKAQPINRILLVETSAADLSSLCQRLASQRLHVEVEENSKNTCRLLSEASYDLVVAGPRLDQLSPAFLDASTDCQQSEMQVLFSAIGPLHEARNSRDFLARLVSAAALVMDSPQTFALFCDGATGEPDFASLSAHPACPANLPDSLRACLGRVAGSENVAGIAGDGGHRASEMDRHLWMVPVTHDSHLQALLGVLSRRQAESPAAARLQMLRLLAGIAGPFLGVLCGMQTLRRKSEDLEAVVQIKSHFLSNLCHEFRSRLGAVQGYSRRVIDGRAGVISDLQQDHLTVVLRNTNKLLDLVSHSVPFVAEQELRVGSIDLHVIWHGAVKRARRRISEKSSRIEEQISAEPFRVIGDKDKLAAVLDMLLASALQCAGNDGEVTAQFLRGANGDVTVRLFATGEGLPPELVDRLFEHHDALASGTPDPGRPRVAGLSLVHDLIWLHGGRISATSNPGEGTVFTFTLPPAPPVTEAEA